MKGRSTPTALMGGEEKLKERTSISLRDERGRLKAKAITMCCDRTRAKPVRAAALRTAGRGRGRMCEVPNPTDRCGQPGKAPEPYGFINRGVKRGS